MRKRLGRPVVLIPLGVVFLVVGIYVGLNGIGAYRTGVAVEDRVMCSESDEHLCFEVVPATIERGRFRRRQVGREWSAQALDGSELGGFSVTSGNSERLEDKGGGTVGVWVKPYDATDPVAVELAEGDVVPTQWIGLRGLASWLAWGLLMTVVGFAMLVTGIRFLRAGSGWFGVDHRSQFGTIPAALVVLPACVALGCLLLQLPAVVALVFCGLAMLGQLLAIPMAWFGLRGTQRGD